MLRKSYQFLLHKCYLWLNTVTIQEWVNKDDRETFVVMSLTVPLGTISSVSYYLAIAFCKGKHNKDIKICNALSTKRYILHLHVLLECYNILSLPQGKFNIELFLWKMAWYYSSLKLLNYLNADVDCMLHCILHKPTQNNVFIQIQIYSGQHCSTIQ